MAKHKVPEAQDLDLTPIMNMVLVLIPLMLLNVVFTTINVIEVSMPQRSAGSAQSNNSEAPKRLQLFISKQGFTIVEGASTLGAIDGCPSGGPTICSHPDEGVIETDHQDWVALYNKLLEIKKKPEWADHTQIEIVADSAMNFGVLVKAMDISRYQLTTHADYASATSGKMMSSRQDLDDSLAVMVDSTDEAGNPIKAYKDLFPVVVLGMPTVSQ